MRCSRALLRARGGTRCHARRAAASRIRTTRQRSGRRSALWARARRGCPRRRGSVGQRGGSYWLGSCFLRRRGVRIEGLVLEVLVVPARGDRVGVSSARVKVRRPTCAHGRPWLRARAACRRLPPSSLWRTYTIHGASPHTSAPSAGWGTGGMARTLSSAGVAPAAAARAAGSAADAAAARLSMAEPAHSFSPRARTVPPRHRHAAAPRAPPSLPPGRRPQAHARPPQQAPARPGRCAARAPIKPHATQTSKELNSNACACGNERTLY